jgi:hypothetical protein
MNKEFIPYQIALDMKSIGFDESCLAMYIDDGTGQKVYIKALYDNHYKKHQLLAPLYQQAFQFFRNKYDYVAIVSPSGDSNGNTIGYYYEIIFDFSKENIESKDYKTYEEAELACLIKLIEIVKNK